MFDIFNKWQDLEEQIKTKNNSIPTFINVFTSQKIDLFIQATMSEDYSIILHMNEETSIDINREIAGIKVSTYINKAVDEKRPSIIIDNLNREYSNIFKAFSATLYENLDEKINIMSIEDIINDTINEYKDYFSGINKQLSDLEQQGLYGELLYLKESILNGHDDALENWEGIYKNKHDFVFKEESIEIKTTRNQSRLNIHISNENQLDNTFTKKLLLCVYRLEKVNVGKTIIDLYTELLDLLPPSKHNLLKSKLSKVGLDFNDDNYCKFREINRYVYNVDDSFPKIDKQMCGERLFDVKYYISLDGIDTVEEEKYNE